MNNDGWVAIDNYSWSATGYPKYSYTFKNNYAMVIAIIAAKDSDDNQSATISTSIKQCKLFSAPTYYVSSATMMDIMFRKMIR